jgi:hypothetical protein
MVIDKSFILGLCILFVIGMICGHVAKTYKNRHYKLWFVLGMLFGILSLIALAIMPKKKKLKEATVSPLKTSQASKPRLSKIEEKTLTHSNPLPMITNQWYYLNDENEQMGPISFQRLKDAYIQEEVKSSSYVWNEALKDWKTLNELPDYLDILKG